MPLLRLFICLLMLTGAGEAFACGFLAKSEPAVGEVVSKSPQRVTVWLTEPVDVAKSWIKVRDAAGNQRNLTKSFGNPQDNKEIINKLPPLPSGTYKVTWHMVAKFCNHVSEGSFPFAVK